MTDRTGQLVVILEEVYREDDAEPIIAAIRMTKGVIDVKPITNNLMDSDHAAHRAIRGIIDDLQVLIGRWVQGRVGTLKKGRDKDNE